jgi:hypothetical protein
MEHSPSSAGGYVDGNHSTTNHLSRWSSNPRPTLNTSLPVSNHSISSELSPHLSPLPSSSPWNPNPPSHFLLPEMGARNPIGGLSAGAPPFNSDWEHLFVPPSSHDSYPTFGANAGFASVASPSGASHSLPGSFQSHYHGHLSNVNTTSHPSPPSSWSQSQSPAQIKPHPAYTSKLALPRLNSSSELKSVKGKSHFTPIVLDLCLRPDNSGF